jgi:Flp pilus assembly protein TadG
MTRNNQRANRRGVILTMELVLVLPVFLILIFAVVEFSLLMSARIRMGDAARNGSRRMCVSGAAPDTVNRIVRESLGPQLASCCEIQLQTAAAAGEIGNVQIRIPMNLVSPDLLWMTGFGLSNRYLQADAPMVTERACLENNVASEHVNRL